MEIDFVNFELAKKLKEKGFKQKCLAYYDVEDNVGLLYNTQYTDEALPCQYTDLLQCHNTGEAETQPDDSGFCVDAPTISQVLKWLREDKNIHIEFVAAAYGYNYIVSDTPEKGGTDRHCSAIKYEGPNDGGAWDKYEEAAIAGIEYCLDNLI